MCTWYFRPKYRTLYSSYNFILFCPLGNINKYGLSARIAKFHGDSLGIGAGWRKSPEECLRNSTSRWRWCRCFAWMLLGVHSVQYFAETQMHHQLCYPVSQPSIPAKEENEVRVSIQVLRSLLPLHSMTTNHAFNSLNWHQTQPVSSLLAPLPFSNVLRSYDWGWSISFMGSFISPGGSPPRLGGSRCLDQLITLQTCSLLISDYLASPMFVLPFAVQGFFSLMEKIEANEEELGVYLLNTVPRTSFLVSDSLWKQFCSTPPWYLFSARKPELCQTLRKPVRLMKVVCSCPPSPVLAPTSPHCGHSFWCLVFAGFLSHFWGPCLAHTEAKITERSFVIELEADRKETFSLAL